MIFGKKKILSQKNLDRVIEALNKQIAMKPEEQKGKNDDEIDYKCPVCGTFAILEYCSKCGQRIDWSVVK